MNESPSLTDISSAPADGALSDRTLAIWEIVSVASSVVIAEWMLASAAGFSKAIIAVPVIFAVLVMFVSHQVRRESLRDLGFRFDNFLPALYVKRDSCSVLFKPNEKGGTRAYRPSSSACHAAEIITYLT